MVPTSLFSMTHSTCFHPCPFWGSFLFVCLFIYLFKFHFIFQPRFSFLLLLASPHLPQPTPHLLLSLLSYTTQNHLSGVGIAHSGLGHSISVNNQENIPTDLPAGQSDEGNSSNAGPSSQMTLTSVWLTKTHSIFVVKQSANTT